MNTRLHLKLVTPAQTIMDCEVDAVSLPTLLGEITILPNHAPLVSVLAAGEATIIDGDKRSPLIIAGGVVEVFQNTIAVLADTAEEPSRVDVAQAEARAQELASKLAEAPTMEVAAYTELMKELEKERAKMRIGKKWQKLPEIKQ